MDEHPPKVIVTKIASTDTIAATHRRGFVRDAGDGSDDTPRGKRYPQSQLVAKRSECRSRRSPQITLGALDDRAARGRCARWKVIVGGIVPAADEKLLLDQGRERGSSGNFAEHRRRDPRAVGCAACEK